MATCEPGTPARRCKACNQQITHEHVGILEATMQEIQEKMARLQRRFDDLEEAVSEERHAIANGFCTSRCHAFGAKKEDC